MFKMKKFDKSNLSALIKKDGGLIFTLFSWAWLILGYVLDIWYQLVPGEWVIDSDLAAEMVLANMLNNEKSILSTNWFYSTELRVFNLQWFYRVGLLIFPNNWTYARTFAMAVFLIIVIAAWLFLMHACKMGTYGVWSAAFLIWPFSFYHHFFSTYGGYYFVFPIFSFAILGIIVQLAKGEGSRIQKILLTFAGAALSFASGLNGPRQTMAFFAPLCLTVIMILYMDIRNDAVAQWKTIPVNKRERLNYIIYTYGFAVFNIIGFLINAVVFPQKYTFQSQSNIYWQAGVESIVDIFVDFIQLFGFRADLKVFSFYGIASGLGFAVGLFMIYSMLRLFKNYSRISRYEQLLLVLSSVAIGVMGMIFCFMNHGYWAHLWLPVLPFGIMIICMELKTEVLHLTGLKSALIMLISACVVISSISTVKLAIGVPSHGRPGLYDVAMWLEEHHYDQGIAAFWDSQCITEMTDGKIEMWTIEYDTDTEFYPWLQDKSHMNPPEGKVFILLSASAQNSKDNIIVVQGNGTLVYDDGSYSVYELEDVSWMGE